MTSPTRVAARPINKAIFERAYLGDPAQVSLVRRDLAAILDGCPMADELTLLASELCTNAIVHSRSGDEGGSFTVHAEVQPADFAWVEVEDQGGPWKYEETSDDRPHGLDIVQAIAGDGNWGIDNDGSHRRVVWVWLDWPVD